MTTNVLLVLAIFATLLMAFLWALEKRWFGRFRWGFLAVLVLASAGIGLAASLLIGIWGYESAERILADGTVRELANIGRIVESQTGRDIEHALLQMTGLARTLVPEIDAMADARELKLEFSQLQSVNPRFLQFDVMNRNGRLVVSLSRDKRQEPIHRIAVAYALEGQSFTSDPYYSEIFQRYVLHLSAPVRSAQGVVLGAVSSRFDLQDTLGRLVRATRFGESGYAVLVAPDGRLLAHPDPRRVREAVGTYAAVQAALRGERGSVVQKNNEGVERLFFYRSLQSPGTVNPKPMALMTEMGEAEAAAPLHSLRRQFIFGTIVFSLVCVLVGGQVAHGIRKPLDGLVGMVHHIEQGDLTARAKDAGIDTLGRLAGSLNEMARGLQERDRIKELFGRYVTTQVSEEVLKGKVNLGGESRRVTMLFSDIRNFTSMAEVMTPTQVVSFLNDYFSEMVEAVFEQGGVLDKFIGDGMMAVFGSFGDMPDHPRRAVAAALRMKALLAKINGERSVNGLPPIQIGIGVHTDEVVVGNIGSHRRLEYTVIGDGVNTSSRVESLNKEFGTTILITSATYELVQDNFECRRMPEARLKGKTRTLQYYEVLSARDTRNG
jgi:class 3 adenylate cyclase